MRANKRRRIGQEVAMVVTPSTIQPTIQSTIQSPIQPTPSENSNRENIAVTTYIPEGNILVSPPAVDIFGTSGEISTTNVEGGAELNRMDTSEVISSSTNDAESRRSSMVNVLEMKRYPEHGNQVSRSGNWRYRNRGSCVSASSVQPGTARPAMCQVPCMTHPLGHSMLREIFSLVSL